jgi:hypothetical protein
VSPRGLRKEAAAEAQTMVLSFLALAHVQVGQFEAATVGARAALVSIEHPRDESVDR